MHRSIDRGSLDSGSVGYGSLDSGRILLRGSGQAIHAIALDGKAAIDHTHGALLILSHSAHTVGGTGLELRAGNLHLCGESTGVVNLRDISRRNHAAGSHSVFIDSANHQVHRADAGEALSTQGQGLCGIVFGNYGFFYVQAGGHHGASGVVGLFFGSVFFGGVMDAVKEGVTRQVVVAARIILGQHVVELLDSIRGGHLLGLNTLSRLSSLLNRYLLTDLLLISQFLLRHCTLSGGNRSGAVLYIPTIHEGNLNFLGGITISCRGSHLNAQHITQILVDVLNFFQHGSGHLNAIQEGTVHNVGARGRNSQQHAVTLAIQGVDVGHHFKCLRFT